MQSRVMLCLMLLLVVVAVVVVDRPPAEPDSEFCLIWTRCPPMRTPDSVGPVVTDIESHLLRGHPYRDTDRITWVHEGTHGIASRLRQQYHRPGFYVLENRAVLVTEPPTTLAAVARIVPPSLRGEVYDLYLVNAQASWNQQPTYIFDEWVAYTNGSEARRCLGIRERTETEKYMLEMSIYALCVPMAADSSDAQLRAFVAWHLKRVVALSGQSQALARLQSAPDAEMLRQFIRVYFGPAWARQVLGV